MTVKSVQLLLLIVAVALQATAQSQEPAKKDDAVTIAKKVADNEQHFRPPPIPIQRRIQISSGLEAPPSFFQENKPVDKIQSRQFLQVLPSEPQPFQTDFQQPQSFNAQQPAQQQFQQRQQFDSNSNQFQQFNQQPQQQQQQFGQQQDQATFQDQNNFQSRQQETLPTLPPVFIPPNQPVGPPPALQSPIRNLFRQPEQSFSLAGLLQRFLNLFNFGNN